LNIQSIINFIEVHHILFVDILIPLIIALITFFSTKKYYINKSIANSPSIKVGGNINAGGNISVGNKINRFIDAKPKNIYSFIYYLDKSKWKKELIGNNRIWICEEDETYQIIDKDNYEKFSAEWTQIYPDRLGSGKHSIILKINNIPIKEIIFIYCDGGRISVPLPEMEIKKDKRVFFWDKNSIEYKLGKIIGHFYIYKDIEGVAEMSKVEIR